MFTERPDLSDEDKKRVEEYLSQPMHQKERAPFRPFYFVLLTTGSVTSLLLLAIWVVKLSGVEI